MKLEKLRGRPVLIDFSITSFRELVGEKHFKEITLEAHREEDISSDEELYNYILQNYEEDIIEMLQDEEEARINSVNEDRLREKMRRY